jgi:anti-anti-sigma factor
MTQAKPLLTYETVDGITVGTVIGTSMLDQTTVSDFGHQAVSYVSDKPGLRLLLNFRNVAYMTSQGLTELLRIADALKKSGGTVRVCNVGAEIYRVFKITNLDGMFSVHEREDVALAVRRFNRALAVAADEKAWAGEDAGR